MATYKVIQDIEAEDHIVGPLSLRQFIYAIIAVLCLYFCYLVISKHAAFLCIIFLPPAIFTGFFALPFGKDQPTEVWALAKIRFLFKPRKRIWNQSGVKELVTITVPKKVEQHLTNGLSQNEVSSRLSALANTIDSRGWAIKNVNVNLYSQPGTLPASASSDRLIDPSSFPQEVPSYDVQASDDILDAQSNPIAQQFDRMIEASAQTHRQQLVSMLNQPTTPQPTAPQQSTAPPNDYWFLNEPVNVPTLAKDQTRFVKSQVVAPGSTDDQAGIATAAEPTQQEEALAEQFIAQKQQPEAAYAHMKTIQPLGQQQPTQSPPTSQTPQPDGPSKPEIEQLSRNNDLSIATLARQVHKPTRFDDNEEVVIALH